MLPENDFSWTHLAIEAAMSALSGLAGLLLGAWKWGRRSAQREQSVKEDYEAKIAAADKAADARMDLLVDQFRESFDGLRRQMDQQRLNIEQFFLRRDDFKGFLEGYRRDQERVDEKLDRLLGGMKK